MSEVRMAASGWAVVGEEGKEREGMAGKVAESQVVISEVVETVGMVVEAVEEVAVEEMETCLAYVCQKETLVRSLSK